MRSLSGTLLEAQRSASGSPYVRVEVVERMGGVARLMWERIYEANKDMISNPDIIQPGMELTIPR